MISYTNLRKRIFPKTLIYILISLTLLISGPISTFGDDLTDYSVKLQDNLKQQSDLQKKISDTVNQEKDLSSQIAYMNNQIRLTELKIDETETNIAQLAIDIDNMTHRLDKLQVQLDSLTNISNQRIRLIHEQNFLNPVAELILNNNGVDNLIMRSQYLSKIRKNDIRVLEQLQNTKTNYNDQKDMLGQKKKQQEDLKTKSLAQKASLDSQKKAKDKLLIETKNSEANYQKILSQLKDEYDVIRNALGGHGVKIGPVKRGQVIATIGEGLIGCSTGPHLHFQFNISGSPVNPASHIDSGELAKPTDGYPGNIHQTFGENANLLFYGPAGHTGLDMGSAGDLVYAAADGDASFVVDQAPCVRGGVPGRAITVDHGSGMKTLYLHVR